MRDTSFSILKAIAIILVVVSHAGAPEWLNSFIFQFHVPIFFICAGYFFSMRYLDEPAAFVKRRVKGLYLPFVRWSLFFLVLHNLFFPLGILSETYGNAQGGVLHPYSWHDFFQRVWNVVFNMSGYDEFICGAFWFFRALFLSSIGFLIAFSVLRKLRPEDTPRRTATLIAGCAIALIVWKIGADLRMTGIAGGGYRELLGVFFMSMGFLFRQYRQYVNIGWPIALGCFVVTLAGAAWFPSCMNYTATYGQFFSLLLPALCGFGFVYSLSLWIDSREGVLKKALIYVGDRTLYIFAFHLLAFKLVSAIKVACYGLPWQQVGGHTVVNAFSDDAFWLLYTFIGVGVPLAWLAGYRYLSARVDLSLKRCTRFAMEWIVKGFFLLVKLLKKLVLAIWASIIGIGNGIKEIIKASNPKEE